MARQLGLDTEEGQDVDLGQFEDADEISEDAAVLFAGLMQSIFSQKKTAASILPMN